MNRTLAILSSALVASIFLFAFATVAQAATRTLPAVSVSAGKAEFKVGEIEGAAVRRAALVAGRRTRSVATSTIRHQLGNRVVAVPLPRHFSRSRIKLRIWTGHPASGPGGGNQHEGPLVRGETISNQGASGRGGNSSSGADGSPAKAPEKGKTKPTTLPPAETTTAPETIVPSQPTTPSKPVGGSVGSPIAIPANAFYVSPSGSDSAPGTEAQPWRTLAKAVSAAGPGTFVVFEPGAYGAVGTTTSISRSGSAGAPITFSSQPGAARAEFHGYIRVTGSHIHLDSILFDGPTGNVVGSSSSNPEGQEVELSIMYGADIEVSNSEVREGAWHAGIFVSNASDVRLVRNYVHDNGDVSTGANLDHGIYWCSGSGSIVENVIEDNVAYGVQLYPEAAGVLVARNTITGNGQGGVIVAEHAANNELLENVIVDNAHYGIRTYQLSGSGNVAKNNILWNNGANLYGTGLAAVGTVISNPATLQEMALVRGAERLRLRWAPAKTRG